MEITAFNGANGAHGDDPDLQKVIQALNVIHDSRSRNDARRYATAYVEKARTSPTSPSFGFSLAQDITQDPIVRHYGLSCLEYHVKFKWDDLSGVQCADIRRWAITLAHESTDRDEPFLRNKIAHLWTAIAQRSWGIAWEDFDQNLCDLWESTLPRQEIVLHILETLSDEVFSKDESLTGVRGAELGKLCVEIFTPAKVLDEVFGQRKSTHSARVGQDGWFQRILLVLRRAVPFDRANSSTPPTLVLKVLSVFRSIMAWVVFKAISDSDCLELLCHCLISPIGTYRAASIEVVHSMFHRQNTQDDQIEKSALLMTTTEGVSILRRYYETCNLDSEDIEEPLYASVKKFSEVLCSLGMYFVHHKNMIENSTCDFNSFVSLLVDVLKHPSLVVSIPVLYLWTKLLSAEHLSNSSLLAGNVETILGICSRRLIRFEMLPQDSTDPSFLFLNEDFDTMPDRHAFLGNYRRFCNGVIERVVARDCFDAMVYLLQQSDTLVRSFQNAEPNYAEHRFASDSFAALSIDAQCTVVSAGLKSYVRAQSKTSRLGEAQHDQRKLVERKLEQWCMDLLQFNFSDPMILKRLLISVVEISSTVLAANSHIAIEVCKSVLSSPYQTNLASSPYDEALKDLQATRPRELQKLATVFSDILVSIYDDLEIAVKKITDLVDVDQKVAQDYRAFLLLIVLRAPHINEDLREAKFRTMLQPVLESWESPLMEQATANFGSFCQHLGLEDFTSIFLSYKAYNIDDWASQPLDERGCKLREWARVSVDRLPLLATRSLLSISTDRLQPESQIYKISKRQWQEIIPVMLPRLLRLVSHAHAFNNPDSWSDYPPEISSIIPRIVQDRVWQNGISSESRDDFYAKIRDSKSTLEGLASAIRGAVRNVRELCMFILHYLSNFGDALYCHHDLPDPLSKALYLDAHHLSPHQLNSLLRLSSALIDGCPVGQRFQFLPPLLTLLFKQLDAKTSAEWDTIQQRNMQNTNIDELDLEMKAESVLRNLTHHAVLMVSNFLGIQQKVPERSLSAEQPTIRDVILISPVILEHLILFCTHALRMHDSRCCVIITRVLRSLIPEFQDRSQQTNAGGHQQSDLTVDPATAARVREFFGGEVLKSCITSLNEPYFCEASLQKDLASVISAILVLYSPATPTPRQVLLSLPGMTERKLDGHISQMMQTSSERQQRAWVLSLLESVRGQSIHELGKVERSSRVRGAAPHDGFMAIDEPTNEDARADLNSNARVGSPDLGGVADLFG